MKGEERLSSHKVTAIFVLTSFFVLFPLSGVVIGVVFVAMDAELHPVITGIIGLVTFAIVVVTWLLITGAILGKMSRRRRCHRTQTN